LQFLASFSIFQYSDPKILAGTFPARKDLAFFLMCAASSCYRNSFSARVDSDLVAG